MKSATILLTFLMVQVAFMLAPRVAFSQTEKLDIIEYTPPKGWKETPKDGLMVFNDYDKNTGGFCLLTV